MLTRMFLVDNPHFWTWLKDYLINFTGIFIIRNTVTGKVYLFNCLNGECFRALYTLVFLSRKSNVFNKYGLSSFTLEQYKVYPSTMIKGDNDYKDMVKLTNSLRNIADNGVN